MQDDPATAVGEPPRVDNHLRAPDESGPGLDSSCETIDFHQSQCDFLARGRANAEQSQSTGNYVSANTALGDLRERLNKARRTRP